MGQIRKLNGEKGNIIDDGTSRNLVYFKTSVIDYIEILYLHINFIHIICNE